MSSIITNHMTQLLCWTYLCFCMTGCSLVTKALYGHCGWKARNWEKIMCCYSICILVEIFKILPLFLIKWHLSAPLMLCCAAGMTCQARTSYTEDEVLWGHRFESCISLEKGAFRVDYSAFDKTFEVQMSLLSAKDRSIAEEQEVVFYKNGCWMSSSCFCTLPSQIIRDFKWYSLIDSNNLTSWILISGQP